MKKIRLGATALWSPLKFDAMINIVGEDGEWNLDS